MVHEFNTFWSESIFDINLDTLHPQVVQKISTSDEQYQVPLDQANRIIINNSMLFIIFKNARKFLRIIN